MEISGTNWALIEKDAHIRRGLDKEERARNSRRASVPNHADALASERNVVPPPRRVPSLASERLDALELLRETRVQKPTGGAEKDASPDGATRARLDVLEQDVVRLRVLVPRRAHDLRPETRVRAQASFRPEGLAVRAQLLLRRVVGLPVGIQRAGERVPVSADVGAAALHWIDRMVG